jgi:hypothetical protein
MSSITIFETNLFEKDFPRVKYHKWLQQVTSKAHILGRSLLHRDGLTGFARTTAQVIAAGAVSPVTIEFPERPAGNNARDLADYKERSEACNLQLLALDELKEFSLSTGGPSFTVSLWDPSMGISGLNMQMIMDRAKDAFGTAQLTDFQHVQDDLQMWNNGLDCAQNFVRFDNLHGFFKSANAELNKQQLLLYAQTAIRANAHMSSLMHAYLLQNPDLDNQSYDTLKAYLCRVSLVIPAAPPSAKSFLGAADTVVPPDSVAHAAHDVRIKQLEEENKRLKASNGKGRRRGSSPPPPGGAGPGAATAAAPAAAAGRDRSKCSMCFIWNQHDPIKFPSISLWKKCLDHNPKGVK